MSRRALLIGGSGQLGTEIRRGWTEYVIAAPSHAQLDLEDAGAVAAAIADLAPDVVVNCAAFHDVDRCEDAPERALAVNAIAVERAARLCRDRGVAFVTVSTDYVFDGSSRRPYAEDDPPHPVSAYGVSKLAGELLIENLGSRALVVRSGGVYGVGHSAGREAAFVARVLAQARAGEPVRVVSDAIASPTFAGHLAQAIRVMVGAGVSGLYHAADVGPVSWYDFAVEALAQAGIRHAVEPIPAREWHARARRPAFSALDSRKLRGLGFEMPSWGEGISAYLQLFRLSGAAQNP
ncbi:MAG: dTDP-4-dehydrorhamnose reductase [Candidatus Tumulicola sp.]